MDFTIKRLGPIHEAKLELGDITVLIGPPNVGKSYTLKALYSSLIMLDPIARNYLLKSTFNELDILKRRRYVDEEEIFRILINLAILYKIYPQKVEKIIKRISNAPNIGQVNIRTENGIITATSKRKENVDLKKLDNLIQKKASLLWGLLPTTDETKVYLESPMPQFLPVLVKSLKKPITTRWKDHARHLSLNLSYFISSKLQEEKAKLILEMTTEIKLDEKSSIIKKGVRQLLKEILLKLEKTENKMEIFKILKDFVIVLTPDVRELEFWIMPEIDTGVEAVINRTINNLVENIGKTFESMYRSTIGIQSILFIPFGRSPLVYQLEYISREPLFRRDILEDYKFDIPLYSYMSKLSSGRARFLEGAYEKEIVQLFESVLQGNLIFDKRSGELKYKRWGFKEIDDKYPVVVPIKWASALAGEVTGILLPVLAVPDKSYIIIEEPESQLYYSAQVLMALALIGFSSLFKHKIVFSTHSDILAITLAYVQEFKPGKDKILELIKKLFEIQNIRVEESNLEPLAKAVSKAKNIDIRFYYYESTPSGVRVFEKKSLDIMKDVPGITDVVNILTTWAMKL